jgi:O-antigen ligase
LSAKFQRILRETLFWVTLTLLVSIPVAFDTQLHRTYAILKLVLLLVGAAALIPLIALRSLSTSQQRIRLSLLFKSRHVVIATLYLVVVIFSALVSRDPTASLFGHFYNQMGLITRVCFFVCFIALIVGIDKNQRRLEAALWAMSFCGFLVSAYAAAQFFGYDPFLPSFLYTSDSAAGSVVRVISTLGHADYLGNFLLYTAPLTAGLAIATRGRARLLASGATILSIIAIVVSGTRGAWLGLISGIVLFVTLNRQDAKDGARHSPRSLLIRATAVAVLMVIIPFLLISLSPASRSIVARARLSFTEGFTGSGRTTLWRDSIKMLPAFALTGCGPDNFRKAFLPYKSKELGRVTPINPESSHNSYLDAAISFGAPGFLLYVAIIISTFRLLLRARRRTSSPRLRIIIVGIISSLCAVSVHNFFIFDQIPTGLYFFAFAALGQAVSEIVDRAGQQKANDGSSEQQPSHKTGSWTAWTIMPAGCVLIGLVAWYGVALLRADAAIDRAMVSADAGDLDQVISNGERAANSAEITGEYNFLFARALVLCADHLEMRSSAAGADAANLIAARDRAIESAQARAEKSLAHTFTPDLNYLFLAYLALVTNDVVKLRGYASEAAKWDPNHVRTRWILAEAYLASGDRYRAAQEAEIALDLDPSSSEARDVLARARGDSTSTPERIEDLIASAIHRAEAGKSSKAHRLLHRAIKLSTGQCPDCHRALALIYEGEKQYENAIAEWQIFISQAPDRVSAERVASRIEALRQER